jgi:hypothetical protein
MAENKWPKPCELCKADVDYDGTDTKFYGFGPCKKKTGNHLVESKTYYHPGARSVADQRDRRLFSPHVILLPVYEYQAEGGKVFKTHGVDAQFSDGKFETADPEQQWYLDQKGDIISGEAGLSMWRSIYLTETQNLDISRNELAETHRQIKESNELLANLKAKQQGKQAQA